MSGLDQEAFKKRWLEAGEDSSEKVVEVAWRRYQQVQDTDYKMVPESSLPNVQEIQDSFSPLLHQPDIREKWSQVQCISLPANAVPWTPTGITVANNQPISILAIGRTWRSKLLDLYLAPQFNLWYKIGVNGDIFNSTSDTRTFNSVVGQTGELYLANQFPGTFQDKAGGRVGGNLSVYDHAEGAFHVLIIQWNIGTGIYPDVKPALLRMLELSIEIEPEGYLTPSHPYHLLKKAAERLKSDYFSRHFPADWKFLWFLGMSEIFFHYTVDEPEIDVTDETSESVKDVLSSGKAIRCCPNNNVGILQKDIEPPIRFEQKLLVTWTWKFTCLPSRLREDTAISHDYLSLAFEFENGRDLTYTWSWELPVDYGYWCPLAAWKDREYHVVIRSGLSELDRWLDEKRDLYHDYVWYINGGDGTKPVPRQVVRVWLIAGNRWQRHAGEMVIKDIRVHDVDQNSESAENGILVVL